MATIQTVERLRILAAHLRSQHRAHQIFDFCAISQGPFNEQTGCGTAGCAIGELPAIWPKNFQWIPVEQNGTWRLMPMQMSEFYYTSKNHGKKRVSCDVAVIHFFDIEYQSYLRLFTPSGSGLGIHATAEQVATHIEQWCAERAS